MVAAISKRMRAVCASVIKDSNPASRSIRQSHAQPGRIIYDLIIRVPAQFSVLADMNTTTRRPRTQSHHNEPRLLYDRKTAARMLSISIRSLDYLIAERRLSVTRIGGRVLVPHAELLRLSKLGDRDSMKPAA